MLRFTLIPKARCKHGHNLEVNLGSQSDTIDKGTPCNLIPSFTYNMANLSTRFVILVGKNIFDFVSRSTTTHIASLPFSPFAIWLQSPWLYFPISILKLVVVAISLLTFHVLSSPVDISHILTYILLFPSSYLGTSNTP